MRSAAPTNLSVLLLIAAHIINPRRPSDTSASQHPLEPPGISLAVLPFIHGVILWGTGMLNTSENCGGRSDNSCCGMPSRREMNTFPSSEDVNSRTAT
jgi:hypothetical protein